MCVRERESRVTAVQSVLTSGSGVLMLMVCRGLEGECGVPTDDL